MLFFIIGLIVWGFVVGGLARLALPGMTATVATGAGEPTTWIVSESLNPPLAARIVASSGRRPATEAVSPTQLTFAMVVSLLVHVTAGLATT